MGMFPSVRSAVLGIGAGTAFALLTVLVVAGATEALDGTWNDWMIDLEWGPAVGLAIAFDVVGGPWVTGAVRIAVGLWLAVRRRWFLFGVWLAVVVPAQVLSLVFKALVGRERPADPLVETSTAAYPSGHVVNATAVALGLVIVATTAARRGRQAAIVVAVMYAVAMALSRTYLRAHWLSDVAGGLALGTAVTLLAAATVFAIVKPGDQRNASEDG